MKSRARQFTATRDKNLSETYSNVDQISRFSASNNYQSNVSQTQSSAFLKRDKKPVCVNCVNHKLVDHRREKELKLREREAKDDEERGIIDQKEKDRMDKNRAKMNENVKRYNQRQAQRQLNSVKSDKHLDTFYLKEAEKRDQQTLQLEAEIIQLKKDKEMKYRDQLHLQCEQEQVRRKKEKEEKLKTKPQDSLIKKNNDNSYLVKHQKQLKRQIEQDKVRKQQQKRVEDRINNKELQEAETDFMKYSEYTQSRKHQKNPEIFEEMKEHELRVKREKEEARKMLEQERQHQMKKAKEILQKEAKAELQKMNRYASELALQMSHKKRQQERSKGIDTRQSRNHIFDEELVQITRQECGQCHHTVKKTYLTYQ